MGRIVPWISRAMRFMPLRCELGASTTCVSSHAYAKERALEGSGETGRTFGGMKDGRWHAGLRLTSWDLVRRSQIGLCEGPPADRRSLFKLGTGGLWGDSRTKRQFLAPATAHSASILADCPTMPTSFRQRVSGEALGCQAAIPRRWQWRRRLLSPTKATGGTQQNTAKAESPFCRCRLREALNSDSWRGALSNPSRRCFRLEGLAQAALSLLFWAVPVPGRTYSTYQRVHPMVIFLPSSPVQGRPSFRMHATYVKNTPIEMRRRTF